MNYEEKLEKRTVKDSVFTDLFSDKKYLLQLYQSLHPEDLVATEDDLTTITLKNVLTNQIYNDLGFAKGDRLIILLECLRYETCFYSKAGVLYAIYWR